MSNPWEDAVIDALVVNWRLDEETSRDPRKAIAALMQCAREEALDPQISEEAKALHDKIKLLEKMIDDLSKTIRI